MSSAFGPKQTWANALHMSAFGGKADIEKWPLLTQADILPWRESEDLPRIEHRGEPPGATCSDAVEADKR
jgi:hypothetical protein